MRNALRSLPLLAAAPFTLAQAQDLRPPETVVVSASSGVQSVADGELRGGGEAYRVKFGAAAVRFEAALGDRVATAPTGGGPWSR